MVNTKFSPEKITRPMQLMAAWFAMLVLVITVLLATAPKISHPSWAAAYLVIFTSVIILIVIGCVLLMLTRYRPHLQDSKEYAQWLKDQQVYSGGYFIKKQLATTKASTVPRVSDKTMSTFTARHNILISVLNTIGSVEIVESLKNVGFNAEIYKEINRKAFTEDRSENESIWIGSRVSSNDAINAIKIAINHWPDMKYLHLSGDGGDPPDFVHDQIFIAGSSETAKRYGLHPWALEELRALDESVTQETFHRLVRSKYS